MQSKDENLVVSDLMPTGTPTNQPGIPFTQIAEIMRIGDSNTYEIVLKSKVDGDGNPILDGEGNPVFYTAKDLEGLQIGYTASDWTVSTSVTAGTLDTSKAHLSAVIADVNEKVGYNQFDIKSSLTFDTDQQLIIDFTSPTAHREAETAKAHRG